MCDERLQAIDARVDGMREELAELNEQIAEIIEEKTEVEERLRVAEEKLEAKKDKLKIAKEVLECIERRHAAVIEKYEFALNTLRDANISTTLGSIRGQPVSMYPCRWKYCTETFLIMDHPRENWCEYCEDTHCEYHVERCAERRQKTGVGSSIGSSIDINTSKDSYRIYPPSTPLTPRP